jgi:hypothetical protein
MLGRKCRPRATGLGHRARPVCFWPAADVRDRRSHGNKERVMMQTSHCEAVCDIRKMPWPGRADRAPGRGGTGERPAWPHGLTGRLFVVQQMAELTSSPSHGAALPSRRSMVPYLGGGRRASMNQPRLTFPAARGPANRADHFLFWTSVRSPTPMMDNGAGFSSHKAGLCRTQIFKCRRSRQIRHHRWCWRGCR